MSTKAELKAMADGLAEFYATHSYNRDGGNWRSVPSLGIDPEEGTPTDPSAPPILAKRAAPLTRTPLAKRRPL